MTISVQCSCGKQLRAPDSAAGKKAKCPACGLVAALPGGKTDPMGSTAGMDPIELDDNNADGSLALDAARQVAQSEDLLTAKCPSCGGRIPPNAVVCVQCGHRFRPQTQTRRPPPRRSPQPQSPTGPPQISMNDIFRSPLSGDTFGQAFGVSLMFFALLVALVVLAFVITLVVASSPSFAGAGTIVIIMAVLGLLAWLNSQFMKVIEQTADVDGRASDRNPGADIFFGIVLYTIGVGPLVLTLYFGHVERASAQSDPMVAFAAVVSAIWMLVYMPMAYAVAATERTVNPVRVFQQIKRMFSAYILALIYIGALSVFVTALRALLLKAANEHAYETGNRFVLFLVQLPIWYVIFYQAIAFCVIMGMLMRRAHYDRGVRASELAASSAWIGVAIVCAVMAVIPTNENLLTALVQPPQAQPPKRPETNDTVNNNTNTNPSRSAPRIPIVDNDDDDNTNDPRRVDTSTWKSVPMAFNGPLPHPVHHGRGGPLGIREGLLHRARTRLPLRDGPPDDNAQLIERAYCRLGYNIVRADLPPTMSRALIRAASEDWTDRWTPDLVDANGATRYQPIGCVIVNENADSQLILFNDASLRYRQIRIDSHVTDNDKVFLFYEVPGVVHVRHIKFSKHLVEFALDLRTPGRQPKPVAVRPDPDDVDTPDVDPNAPDLDPDDSRRHDNVVIGPREPTTTKQIPRPRLNNALIALPTTRLPARGLIDEHHVDDFDIPSTGLVRAARGTVRTVRQFKSSQRRRAALYFDLPRDQTVRVALSEDDSKALFKNWSRTGAMNVPSLVDDKKIEHLPRAVACINGSGSSMYLQFNPENPVRRWPKSRPNLFTPRIYLYYQIAPERLVVSCRWPGQTRDLTYVGSLKKIAEPARFQPKFTDGHRVAVPFIDSPRADLEFGRGSEILRANDRFDTRAARTVPGEPRPKTILRITPPDEQSLHAVQFPTLTVPSIRQAIKDRRAALMVPVLFTETMIPIHPIGCIIGSDTNPSVRVMIDANEPLTSLTAMIDSEVADDDRVYFYFAKPASASPTQV
ncbi:MAG: hypothetical protein CMJ49_03710 [Planctomycetaceae bacterium]|nr:hypothetical protein [Planctomycetaceae bacterium]